MWRLKQLTTAHSSAQWFGIKLSLVLPTVVYMVYCLNRYQSIPFPSGLCQLFNCGVWLLPWVKVSLLLLLLAAAAGYLLERYMLLSTALLTLISLLVLSVEKSNGVAVQNGLITLLYAVQWLAYALHAYDVPGNLAKQRVQFSLQVIAAVYVLSAIAKLSTSGIGWFTTDAPLLTLEVMRKFYATYAATGDAAYLQQATFIAGALSRHVLLLQAFLGSALLLELFAFVMLAGGRIAKVYAMLLLGMHVGIYAVLHIQYPSIVIPLLAVAVNPLYLVYRALSTLRLRLQK